MFEAAFQVADKQGLAVLCAQALADVHRRGFIHRDVKTENFCLDAAGSNNSIKIIDFGFSRMAFGACL